MEHAGILHQLAPYLAFPYLDRESYSLQNTGYSSIEAIHLIFCGVQQTFLSFQLI